MRTILTKSEAVLLVAFSTLLSIALAGPALQARLPGPLADLREIGGVLYAFDALSCLPFAGVALAGAALIYAMPQGALANMQRAMGLLFFGGLLLVAFGSASYHLDPGWSQLAFERYCTAFAIAGLVGLAAATQVSERAGAALGLAMLVLALRAAQAGEMGNVLPWALVQAGAVALLAFMAMLRPEARTLEIDWAMVLLLLGAARLLEVNDAALFTLSGELVSGHTLHHVAAALAGVPVIAGLLRCDGTRQNASPVIIADDVALRAWRNA